MMKKDIQAIYPLSPMQEGMLFHSLYAPESGAYCTQFVCTLVGRLDLAAFERAWQKVVERHPVLRTAFVWEGLARPMQVVGRRARLAVALQDWRDLPQTRQQEQLQTWLAEDRRQGFMLSKAPLMRLTILRLGEQTHEVIWSHH